MHCDNCGEELSQGARFCAGCGASVESAAKAQGSIQPIADKTVDLAKKTAEKAEPVAKAALRLTGKGLAKLGSLTERAGKKLKEKVE